MPRLLEALPRAEPWAPEAMATSASIAARFTGSAVRFGLGVPTRGSSGSWPNRPLTHAVERQAKQCYARSDVLERRRDVMEAWGAFLDGLDP